MFTNSLLSDNRVSLVLGAVVAVTAAIYVAYGPGTEAPHASSSRFSKKRKKRNGGKAEAQPRGLYNSGNTCFVNAVLQAVAACPSLLLWLEENGNQFPQAKEKHHLQTSLLTVLRVINGFDIDVIESSDGESEVGDPEVWAPARLFRALSAHGWVANYQEQDAHEFFQALFATLEDELRKDSKLGQSALSLLPDAGDQEEQENQFQDSTSEQDHEAQDIDSFKNDERGREQVRRRRTRSRSSSGVVIRSSARGGAAELSMNNIKSQKGLSLTSLTPFTGTITNKIIFKESGKSKSPTTSITFNNITLSLPQSGTNSWMGARPPVTLETLLTMYVSRESVSSSKDESQLVKQLTFARLPECLALHIQRTAYENGFPMKREDQVLFPTVLNMDNYVYNRQVAKRKAIARSASVTNGQAAELEGSGCDAETPLGFSSLIASPSFEAAASNMTSMSMFPSLEAVTGMNSNYTLRAVVVHLGGIDSGHFVTYRREPSCPLTSEPSQNSKTRKSWFCTSDSVVREVPVEDVLKSNPYMLFYEKMHPESQD